MASPSSLWTHGPFVRLWVGQTLAHVAAQISFLAIPLVATVVLNATPAQMGLLTAAASLPSLVLGLHVGAIVDRRSRRPILVGADLVRALTLALVPVAWWLDLLSIPLLCLLVVVSAAGSLLFDIAYQAFLPTIVERSRLVEGNSRLELSRTASELVGPGLAGSLIHVLGAPFALLLNGVLYLGSALLIWSIRVREQVGGLLSERDTRMTTRIRAGIGVVWRTRSLREVVGANGVLSLFNAMLETVFILYVVRVLHVGPAMLGVIFGIGSLGFVAGALLPPFANRTLGIGAASAIALATIGLSDLLVPLSEGMGWLTIPFLVAAQFLFGIGMTLFNVNQASIRQLTVPAHLLGRATATARFVAVGVIPIGALLGGLLGETIGLRQTLVLASCGELAAAVLLWCSPLRRITTVSDRTLQDVDNGSI